MQSYFNENSKYKLLLWGAYIDHFGQCYMATKKKRLDSNLSLPLPAQCLGSCSPSLSLCLIMFKIKKTMIWGWDGYEILLIRHGEQGQACMGVSSFSFICVSYFCLAHWLGRYREAFGGKKYIDPWAHLVSVEIGVGQLPPPGLSGNGSFHCSLVPPYGGREQVFPVPVLAWDPAPSYTPLNSSPCGVLSTCRYFINCNEKGDRDNLA